MTNAKQQAAAQIIKDSALEFLAAKHGLTVDQVAAAIKAGNLKACEQFRALVVRGVDEAVALAEAGKISLT